MISPPSLIQALTVARPKHSYPPAVSAWRAPSGPGRHQSDATKTRFPSFSAKEHCLFRLLEDRVAALDSDSRGQWSVDIQPPGGPISEHFSTLPPPRLFQRSLEESNRIHIKASRNFNKL
jgi:hypothetical protein